MDDFYMEFKNPIGRPLKYSPNRLAEKFAEYVEWCREHPLVVKRNQTTNGSGKYNQDSDGGQGFRYDNESTERKPRYVSIGGFLVFIGGNDRWWSELENGRYGEAFSKVKEAIAEYCKQYQIEMASNGLFKQNIISRLLGLADNQKVDQHIKAEGLKIEVADQETADILAKITGENN